MHLEENNIEWNRLLHLSNLDLNFGDLQDCLGNLTQLAAKLAGTEISLVNIIDSYTQWSVASHGLDLKQMPREETVCQYTILEEKGEFEIPDMSDDSRFKGNFYVKSDPFLKYYYGIALKSNTGVNLGALCVLDKNSKQLDHCQKKMLHLIAIEVVDRLQVWIQVKDLRNRMEILERSKRKITQDLGQHIGGIVGIARMIEKNIERQDYDNLPWLASLLRKDSMSIREIPEQSIHGAVEGQALAENRFSCESFSEALFKLYNPQAEDKQIELSISVSPEAKKLSILKSPLLAITGNLISHSIVSTPANGKISLQIDARQPYEGEKTLEIILSDSSAGIDPHEAKSILDGKVKSILGTDSENLFGYGLSLVKHLTDYANGSFVIDSKPGNCSVYTIKLPV